MAQVLPIAHLGHPVLREKAAIVDDVTASPIQDLIDDMLATLTQADGVGLAAPQVYQSKRIIIVASKPNPRYPLAPQMDPTPMINPVILGTSAETKRDWEGCLSVPGIRGMVPRSETVSVRYLDRQGKTHEKEYSGFIARILQHEVDHLDGIFFLDRMNSVSDLVTDREYARIVSANTSTS